MLICVLVTVADAHSNPFRSPASAVDTAKNENRAHAHTAENPAVDRRPAARLPFMQKLFAYQGKLTSRLSRYFREVKEQRGVLTIAGLLLLSFFYGVIHSLGPGHAKALFISHTITRPTPVHRIIVAAALFSATHAGIAIALFLTLRMLLGLGQGDVELYSQKMLAVSGVLVLIAGLFLAASSSIENKAESSLKRTLHGASSLQAVAVFAGLAPCPGAFLILVFTSIIGILPIGLFAVGAVSVGMAATVSVIASAGGLLSNRLARKKFKRSHALLGKALRLAGAGAIATIGVLMILHG